MTNKTRMIEALSNGTVIDHIPAGQALRLIELLKLKDSPHAITVGLNLESKRLGKKDILKITGRYLTEKESAEVAVFAPDARINIVKDYDIIEKRRSALPAELHKILVCPNVRCISHSEAIDSHFEVEADRTDIRLSCHYCEGVFSRSDIRDYRT
ncbi:MAG: aspartate carbamoyltransferase regulatory subunit [Gammaproteobacteria bacterium]|nr:aspartate carbamoyltransferase regulatory subunit [Gammaproteobacteria bacterium]